MAVGFVSPGGTCSVAGSRAPCEGRFTCKASPGSAPTVGALLGGGYNHKLSVDGIDLSSFVEAAGTGGIYDSMPMSSMLYTESSLAVAAGAALVGLLVAVLSSVYPAVIAARLPPAEAMRAE